MKLTAINDLFYILSVHVADVCLGGYDMHVITIKEMIGIASIIYVTKKSLKKGRGLIFIIIFFVFSSFGVWKFCFEVTS